MGGGAVMIPLSLSDDMIRAWLEGTPAPAPRKRPAEGVEANPSSERRRHGEVRHTILKPGQRMPQVSSMGRSRSSKGVVTRPKPKKNGYVRVGIFEKGYQMHALVTRAFHGPAPSPQHTPNHIDRDPGNNSKDNLEWGSKREQVRHSYDTNPDRKSNAGQISKPIKATRVDEAGAEQEAPLCFASQSKAAGVLRVNHRSISACCRGKQQTAGAKDKQLWRFDIDTEAAQPALLEGERWEDVVAGLGLHEVGVKGITTGQPGIPPTREEVQKRGKWPRVSSLGRYQDSFGVIKVPLPKPSGYVQVEVFRSVHLLHGLMARAFLGKVPEGHTVDHLDHDPGNNALGNLRYLTHAQQVAASYATNPDRKSNAGQRSKPIKATRVEDAGAEQEAPLCFASQSEAARELMVDVGSISACCRGKRPTAGGWRFCFDTDAGEPECIEGEEWRDVVMAPADDK